MMKSGISLAFCACLSLAMVAEGGALVAPTWQGLEGSTFQHWTLDTDANPAFPDTANNGFGPPLASITVGAMGAGWIDDLGLGTEVGYWDLGGAGGVIGLDIPIAPPDTGQADMLIQTIYYVSLSVAPSVDIPGGQRLSQETELIEPDPVFPNSGWYIDRQLWQIQPAGSMIHISLGSDMLSGFVVSQIAVDTLTVPEPTSLAMLFTGALILLKRRRR